jgi:mono/diheme cytochrome c family protein
MKSRIRFSFILAAVATMTAAVCLGQSAGKDIYKIRRLNCHGTDGMASTGSGLVLRVKPLDDPAVKKYTLAEMIELTRNGMGKMQAYKGVLTDQQIKDSVAYFRSFLK